MTLKLKGLIIALFKVMFHLWKSKDNETLTLKVYRHFRDVYTENFMRRFSL